MTYMRFVAALILCAALVAAGCARRSAAARGTTFGPLETVPVAPPAAEPPAAAPLAAAAPLTDEELFARKTLAELNDERPLDDVFFALDDASISETGRATLQRNAEWLARWRSTHITIEGHCDERGTAEYNLALGDRRARNVREYLVSLGIEPHRLEVVSKGKESPICHDRMEACWLKNRRGHSIITAK